ncbi:YitT family protein [Metabacillus sp. RGM 3146]|uniref:YitT family protein n=1 Tax=Metabacillus sp. RGM 3146 TaxID=3401092 RepID=UPI003B991810
MKKKIGYVIAGGSFIGIGINAFILPLHLMNGGVFGISLLLKYLFGFKLGLTIVCINTPIYLIALKYHRTYFVNGMIGMAISSLFIELCFPLNGMLHLPYMISTISGGIFIGAGAGMMLRQHTSPGGIDLLALMISKWTAMNTGILMAAMDGMIICAGLLLLKDPRLLYSLITIGIAGMIVSILTSIKSIQVIHPR